MKKTINLLAAMALPAMSAAAMDRLDALSQIESHNNDLAIGRQQEVSRYQVLPAYWAQARIEWDPTDPQLAKEVVSRIMQARCRVFKERYHRLPDDFEYYILWHRPACYIGRPQPRPLTTAEADRGHRFAHLCQGN